MKTVQIKKDVLLTLDHSYWRKDFWYAVDGQTFTIHGEKACSIPDEVADAWVAHDTQVEIINIS